MSHCISSPLRLLLLDCQVEYLALRVSQLEKRILTLSSIPTHTPVSIHSSHDEKRQQNSSHEKTTTSTSKKGNPHPLPLSSSSPPEFIPTALITYPPPSSPLYPFNPQDHPSLSIKFSPPLIISHLSSVCHRVGLTKNHFLHVSNDYYNWELEARRDVLGARSIHQLCKSIVMENIKHPMRVKVDGEGEREGNGDESDGKNNNKNQSTKSAITLLPTGESVDSDGFTLDGRYIQDPLCPRYVLVIVQYSAKLHKEKLVKAIYKYIQGAAGEKNDTIVLSKNKFNWRLCDSALNDKLSGYSHNSVCPLGLRNEVLIVMSHLIWEGSLEGEYFWLGGGHVDVKMRNDIKEFRDIMKPIVADITY